MNQWISGAVIAIAVPIFVYLFAVTAPYGRHLRPGWGPSLPPRVGWIVMESPAVFVWLAVYLTGPNRAQVVPLVFLGLWQLHYVHRTLVFPFRLSGRGRPIPLVVAGMGFTFNAVNAFINARQVSALGDYGPEWAASPWFVLGVGTFLVGMAINHHADAVLLTLRAPGESGYRIPRGGLYRFVSCPNYLGEMVEWAGWALATRSLAGLAFAVFTMANLLPRALAHHRWYQRTFSDYPPERKAVVPFVL